MKCGSAWAPHGWGVRRWNLISEARRQAVMERHQRCERGTVRAPAWGRERGDLLCLNPVQHSRRDCLCQLPWSSAVPKLCLQQFRLRTFPIYRKHKYYKKNTNILVISSSISIWCCMSLANKNQTQYFTKKANKTWGC